MDEMLNRAKELRKNQTEQEKILWYQLRGKRFLNLKFRRQVPIENYIVDFLCEKQKLIIELDGGQHNLDEHVEYDNKRTEFLESLGYRVVRFWNTDITQNLEGVLMKLELIIEGKM